MELGQLRFEVGEAAQDRLAVLGLDQNEHLLAQQAQVLREEEDLLERAVMQIQAQAHEQPLVRLRQARSLVVRRRGYADSTVSAATRFAR